MAFELHPRLHADTTWIGDFPLCRVLLSKEDIGPWFILVPKIVAISELHHLDAENQQQFMRESCLIAQLIEAHAQPDKLNIAALGNMVPQLHIHHIARFVSDVAWPNPVWGNTDGTHRSDSEQLALSQQWKAILCESPDFTAS